MNFQQLEYIIAVDKYRHFAKAANKSFVTQPTLSMMIQKLEVELGVKIFDRTRQPVVPTKDGEEVIRRAKLIVAEASRLKEFANELKGEISGEVHIGIIPTLAPYLLPRFLSTFSAKHPNLRIYIKEMVTDDIIRHLNHGDIDMGLLATPLHHASLEEHHLFFEEFFAYASQEEKLPKKKYILPAQIDSDRLLLLEEGHCMRSQIFNLCTLRKANDDPSNLHYEAGSIETLINLVDRNQGITIVPHLATLHLSPAQLKNIREFAHPKPVREISVVVQKGFPRKKILDFLRDEIVNGLPEDKSSSDRRVLEFDA